MNKAQFITELIVTPLPTPFFARSRWKLRQELVYAAEDGSIYTVPCGFVSDLASIPMWLYPIMKPAGSFSVAYAPAAVVHDWALQQENISTAKAHLLFKEALIVCGASQLLSNLMYWAVNRPKQHEVEFDDITDSGQDNESITGGT